MTLSQHAGHHRDRARLLDEAGLESGVRRTRRASGGEGAAHAVSLPVRAVATTARKPSSATDDQRKLLEGLRVLVCEDDPDSRDLLHTVLVEEGATVCLAAAATEALEHFGAFRPDILVSDIGMPVMDGYALIRQIRGLAQDEGGCTPAIALTAYAGREDAHRAYAAGYQLHVPKPVDPSELAVRIATLVGRSGRDDHGQ